MGRYSTVLFSAVVACFMLSACEMAQPSRVNTSRITVEEQRYAVTFDRNSIGVEEIRSVIEDYRKAGQGALEIHVVYGGDFQPLDATKEGSVIRQKFADRGFDNAKVAIVPARSPDMLNKVVLVYQKLVAKPPEDCERFPNLDGAVNEVESYSLGCETSIMMTRQIVRPGDLLGTEPVSGQGSARRQAGVVEPYKTGEPLVPIEGLQASGLGEGD